MMRAVFIILTCAFTVAALLSGVAALNGHTQRTLFPQQANAASVILGQTPPQFSQSKHVQRSVVQNGGQYLITYRFKDHRDIDREWKVAFPVTQTDGLIYQFGVPPSLFEPYSVTEAVIAKRNQQMKDGLFRQDGNYLVPDHDRMAGFYKGFTRSIAALAGQVLGPSATQTDVIEFMLRFCQDIPYGVPPSQFDGRHIGQIFPPAQTLVNLYGDCDSKVVLFASAISHFGDPDMLYVHTPGHLSVAIAGIPKPYQGFVTYKNKKYIYAEPVGPGRLAFGYDALTSQRIEKLREANIPQDYQQVNYQLFSRESRMPTAPTSGEVRGNWADGDKGQLTFWLNSPDYGAVTVYINDALQGELKSYQTSDPDCGGTGTVSVLKPAGTYRFKALGAKGVKWESTVTIVNNQCKLIRLGK